jgi:hypothetical protein
MKIYFLTLRPSVILLGGALSMFAVCCGDDDEPAAPVPAPVISEFTPTSGVVGTEVTITGTNFSMTASENVVKFNGVEAEVTAATATSLTVIVPEDASNGKITVAVGGEIATSATNFTIPELEISETFPPIAAEGITVKITGSNFSLVEEYNIVTFDGVEATVTSVSENELTVVVPEGATTGPLTVKVGTQIVVALDEFEICGGGPELVISGAKAFKTIIATSYDAWFTVTNVGSEDADLSKITLQNYATDDPEKEIGAGAGGFPLSVNSLILKPGESFFTDKYGASIVGGNTTTHPYLAITLYPDGSVPECNTKNNVVVVPFE